MGGLLGCGETRIFLQERGGGTILGALPWTGTLSYGRRIDEMTSGRATVPTEGLGEDEAEDCCRLLNLVNAWEHELLITRDSSEAWVGVLLEPEWSEQDVVLDARDLFQWFERRFIHDDHDYQDVDLSQIFLNYANDALGPDLSPNITVAVAPTNVVGIRKVLASQSRRAADEMRELARSGLDFTMIGRIMRAGGSEIPVPALATLSNATLKNRRLRQRGAEAASSAAVIGSRLGIGEEAEQVVGTAGGVDAKIGLVELAWNEDGILDQTSANAAAQSRVNMLKRAPYYLTGDLDAETPISFEDLIPGARVDFDGSVGCKQLSASFRLGSVDVAASVSDPALTEVVSVTLIPAGSSEVV